MTGKTLLLSGSVIAELVILFALIYFASSYKENGKKREKILCNVASFLVVAVFAAINYKILFG